MIYDPGVIMLCLDFRGQGLSLSCHVLFERLKLRFRLFLTENRKYSLSHVKQKKKFVNHFLSLNFSFSTNNTRLLSCMHSFAICSPSLSKVAVVDILYEPNAKYKPNVENIFI
jgi:hypothetical protein